MSIVSELVSVLGTVFGVVGVVLTIGSNRKSRKLKAVTWSDIHSATKFFWRKLKKKVLIWLSQSQNPKVI